MRRLRRIALGRLIQLKPPKVEFLAIISKMGIRAWEIIFENYDSESV